MQELKHNKLARPEYKEDVVKLKEQLNRAGFNASLTDISYAWQEYSDSMCAGCMCLNDNEEDNVIILRNHLDNIFEE